MKALFKLKSVLVLLIAASSVKAQNLPFVEWPGGAPPPMTLAQVKDNLKLAMQGKPIAGATAVHCTAGNFTAVISETAYNELLAAPHERIDTTTSDGTERNNGINPTTKKTAPGGILEAKTAILKFTASNGEIVKIKFGSNGCYNVQGDIRKTIARQDPDEKPATTGNPWALIVKETTTNNNTITTLAPPREMSAMEYLGAASVSRAYQREDIRFGADLMKEGVTLGASLKTCCDGGTNQGNTISLGQIASYPQVSAQPNVVVVKSESGGSSFWPTFAGTAVGSTLGTVLGNAINGGGRTQVVQQPIYIPPTPQPVYNYTNFNPYGTAVQATSGFYNETPFGVGTNTSSLSGVIPISGFQ